MSEYRLVTSQAGNFDEKINALTDDGWYVESVMNQGNHFYTVLYKYNRSEDDEDLSDAEDLYEEQAKLNSRLDIVEGALALRVKEATLDTPSAKE